MYYVASEPKLAQCVGQVRDLQAREHLHWRLTGRQETTPVAIMTSAAKGNHGRVLGLLAAHAWFGRGRDSFRRAPCPGNCFVIKGAAGPDQH